MKTFLGEAEGVNVGDIENFVNLHFNPLFLLVK
jgi:hypothetical protein